MLHSLMIGSQILKVLLYTFLCYHCLVELLSHFVLAVTVLVETGLTNDLARNVCVQISVC